MFLWVAIRLSSSPGLTWGGSPVFPSYVVLREVEFVVGSKPCFGDDDNVYLLFVEKSLQFVFWMLVAFHSMRLSL